MVGLPESILSSYIKGVPWIRKFPNLPDLTGASSNSEEGEKKASSANGKKPIEAYRLPCGDRRELHHIRKGVGLLLEGYHPIRYNLFD
ncbi:MAG: hypothetical protein ABSG92_05155 [Conexivisphaerales archaeon]|jgi:hypothetical protein